VNGKRVALWTTRIEVGFQPEALRVQFAYTRTTYHSIELRLLGREEAFVLERIGTSAVRLDDLPCLQKGDQVLLMVVYQGDTPVPVSVRILSNDKPVRVAPLAPQWFEALRELPELPGVDRELQALLRGLVTNHRRRSLVPVQVLTACSLADLLEGIEPDQAQGAADVFAERELAIDAHYRVARFFLALDRGTDVVLADPAWRATMARAGAELELRLKLRAYHAEHGRGVTFHAPRPEVVPALGAISAVFQKSATELAGHPWRLLPYAFELFVAGRLAVAHVDPALQALLYSHGAPNSWNYFLFAELAAACLESGIDAGFWEEALVALVGSAELLSRNPAQPPAPEMTSDERAALYGYRDGRALRMEDVHLARQAYAVASGAYPPGPERRRCLCDSFGALIAGLGYHNFSSVYWTPGDTHPLTYPAPLAKSALDARAGVA
jgi:hypothetical protein